MSEFMSYVPLIALAVSSISAIIGILTYLRVSRKYYSRFVFLQREIKPKEDMPVFDIDGTGFLQKIEMTAKGSADSMITIQIDNLVFLRETFLDLYRKSSSCIRVFSLVNPKSSGYFSLEMDVEKNFFKNIGMLIENVHEKEHL